VVFWHQVGNKKDFCPFRKSEIVSLLSNGDSSIVCVVLKENSIKIIQTSNYTEKTSISLFSSQDPQLPETAHSLWKQIVQHPITSMEFCYWMLTPWIQEDLVSQFLPGYLHFYNAKQMMRSRELSLTRRNLPPNINEQQLFPQQISSVSN